MKLKYTRAMVHALLHGELAHAETETDPVFGLHVPTEIPNVPAEILKPRNTWADKAAYDAQAAKLAGMFTENFRKFADKVGDDVKGAGPGTAQGR
jgi:phosphoenolpyruvate carboxykinase (ATP)